MISAKRETSSARTKSPLKPRASSLQLRSTRSSTTPRSRNRDLTHRRRFRPCWTKTRNSSFRFGRIFFERLFHHVVDFPLDFGGVAFVLTGNCPPDQGARGGIAEIDDQRAFGIRYADNPSSPAAPSRRIPLQFRPPRGPEVISHVEIGFPVRPFQTAGPQIAFDIGFDLLLYQFTIQNRILAVQLAVADGEGFVPGEIGSLVKLHR